MGAPRATEAPDGKGASFLASLLTLSTRVKDRPVRTRGRRRRRTKEVALADSEPGALTPARAATAPCSSSARGERRGHAEAGPSGAHGSPISQFGRPPPRSARLTPGARPAPDPPPTPAPANARRPPPASFPRPGLQQGATRPLADTLSPAARPPAWPGHDLFKRDAKHSRPTPGAAGDARATVPKGVLLLFNGREVGPQAVGVGTPVAEDGPRDAGVARIQAPLSDPSSLDLPVTGDSTWRAVWGRPVAREETSLRGPTAHAIDVGPKHVTWGGRTWGRSGLSWGSRRGTVGTVRDGGGTRE